MTTPHLILHKVRGEAAFDVAEPITIGEEEAWIIPTSGHRAYPYWSQPLYEIVQEDVMDNMEPMPANFPDHYSEADRLHSPCISLTTASALLAKLGLGSKPIKRRRID